MSTINLLPQDVVQRRSQSRANLICVTLFAVVTASIGGAALVSERNTRRTREVCQRINASYTEAAKLIDQVYRLEAQKRTMLRKAEMSANLMERLPRSYVLSILANALPKGAKLTSVEMTVAAARRRQAQPAAASKHGRVAQARKTGPADPPELAVSMKIRGRAGTDVQVARFIARLAKHPLTDVVDLSYSKEARRADAASREFLLTVRLKPGADAMDGIEHDDDGENVAAGAGPSEPPPGGEA